MAFCVSFRLFHLQVRCSMLLLAPRGLGVPPGLPVRDAIFYLATLPITNKRVTHTTHACMNVSQSFQSRQKHGPQTRPN